MEVLSVVAALSDRINQLLADAVNDTGCSAVSSGTLNTLSGLVLTYSRKITRATVDDILLQLIRVSDAYFKFVFSPNRITALHSLDNFLGGREFTDHFFREYLVDQHAPHVIENFSLLDKWPPDMHELLNPTMAILQ